MGIKQKLIEEIVRRVLGATRVERIILFGSAAIGNMSSDSDIDLLVLEDSPGDIRHEMISVRTALLGLGFPFDVLVMPTEQFEESKDVIGGIAYPANKYGRVIYDTA